MSGGVSTDHFHAPFLDGVRGLAVAAVVWQHADMFRTRFCSTDETNPGGALLDLGGLGVCLFFVLSAFLLTYLCQVEWEAYCLPPQNDGEQEQQQAQDQQRLLAENEKKQSEKSDSVTVNVPADSMITEAPIVPDEEHAGLKVWIRYFIRRFFRIWPPYVLMLIIACIIPLPIDRGDRLYNFTPLDVLRHAALIDGFSAYWTIPLECSYYLVIPLIVLMYVGVQQISRRLKPTASLVPARIIGLLILAGFHAAWYEFDIYASDHMKEVGYTVEPSFEKHYFTMGSIGALLFVEWKRSGLLPRSTAEEKALNLTPRTIFWGFITLPTVHSLSRAFFDALALLFVIMSLSLLPHWAVTFYQINYIESGDLANRMAGASMVAMLLACEASRDGYVKSFYEAKVFRLLGKWSFSIYLLHLFILNQVNTLMNPLPTIEPDRALYAFDYFLLALTFIIVICWLWHEIVEVPSINAGAWLIQRYAAKKKRKQVQVVKQDAAADSASSASASSSSSQTPAQ
jgi:peptidoglycan/LPS O-acetylase OafA/YrhL